MMEKDKKGGGGKHRKDDCQHYICALLMLESSIMNE